MAVLQACMKNAFRPLGKYRISNSLSSHKNKIVLHQSSRGRHDFIHQLPIYRNEPGCRKLFQTIDVKQKYIYRLASTNVTTGKTTDSSQSISDAVKNNETGISEVSNTVGEIDDLPSIPTPDAAEVADFIAGGLKEQTLESLGLAKLYKPSGIIQYILEFLHVNMDLPWWAAIAAVTFTTRLLLLPVSARVRRNAVHAKNNGPELQRLQREFSDARHSGSYYDAALAAQNLQKFMTEKNFGMSSIVPGLIQVPVFLTVFFGLKGMKEVESLKTGGMLWFKDMTQSDPYYILPLVSAATAWSALQIGSESGKFPMPQQEYLMKVMKVAFPVIIFVATFRFPTCLVFYWTVSNIFTLFLQLLFLIRPVAKFFKIPEVVVHDIKIAETKKKGFREGFKESMTNFKVLRELSDRERLNTVTFEKAGSAPIQRTFKTNPKAQMPTVSCNK